MEIDAAHALVRFGLGRKGAEPAPADPTAWLREQIEAPDPIRFPSLPDSAACLTTLREERAMRRENPPAASTRVRDLLRAETSAQMQAAMATEAPFRERLVWFWGNHFAVSLRHGGVAAVAGAYVREAIRPHVTGRFADMLLSVMRHPAMLIYLDNVGSVGPDSPAGLRMGRGMNENLARECLELHTLGADGGFTQADVTSFARILTGWSIDLQGPEPGFLFRAGAHEPGAQTLLGHRFEEGEAGGRAALAFLATHPATYRYLAGKLATHFIADTPPADAVDRIASRLADTGGDLGAAALAVVAERAAWQPLTKLRTPLDFVVACARALDLREETMPDVHAVLGGLGEPLWMPPLPNGWPDRAADWAAPELLMRRIDWAHAVSGRAAGADPVQFADTTLGPLLRPETRAAMERAGSRRDAITLFLGSPEFQRR